jgi:membrane-associated phospholipid phosphatase
LTSLSSIILNTGFGSQLSLWYLTEAQLSLITPGTYNVNVNLGPYVFDQYFDVVSAAVFNNVDQVNPFLDLQTASLNGALPNTWQIPNPINVNIGGVTINGIFTGNNTTPNSLNGATNCWSINSGFVEATDVYRSWTGASTTGGCFQSAHKLGLATGVEQPSTTFSGVCNRRVNIAVSLRRAEILDNSVQLEKSGTAVGNDYGLTGNYWPLVDAYTSYGGPTDLWGTTWSFTEINNNNFGAISRCNIPNGSAEVDHYRMTVYTQSILPVELIDFFVLKNGGNVDCSWIIASELNSDYFIVQRSEDGKSWEDIGQIKAAGNSNSILNYSFSDDRPFMNTSYYRLKQIDIDGSIDYSDVKSVDFENSNVEVYPNPTANWANIQLESGQENIQILNSFGQVIDVQQGTMFDKAYRFNLSQEPDGVYFIIITKEDRSEIKRLVKQSAFHFNSKSNSLFVSFLFFIKNLMRILLILMTLFFLMGSNQVCLSQNKDIEWLRVINLERNQKLDPLFKGVSQSITPVIVGAPVAVLAIGLIKKDSSLTRNGIVMVGAFCVNSALTLGLKFAINRPRPFVTYPEIQKLSAAGSYSFPSGHSSSAFAAATSLSLAFPKWYVVTPSFLWAGAVAYSRMHLGVHYPSDFAAGALIGVGSAFACHWLNKKIHWERKKNWFL